MLDQLKHIFLFSEETPLSFVNLYFWIFFGIIYTGYALIYDHKRLRNSYLFFISLFFYYKTSGFFFTILLFSTLIDFWIGKKIGSSTSENKKKLLIILSVFINLSLLVYFKYAHFFVNNINEMFGTNIRVINHFSALTNWVIGSSFEAGKILLPVGISFFTFQTISYSVDVYRGRVKPVTNIFDFGFYVSFFPQLVAGPIVRASDFIPQLYQKFRLRSYGFGLALFWILKGLIKKMIIGDYIAVNLIDMVFDNPLNYSGFENLLALYGYSLQVYADFSGYTDIAIGLALLMGFRLPKNFNSPYKAKNVGDFWKRWHISLSNWLKDYLYIPSGGNRGGTVFTYVALSMIIAFIILLTGNIWYLYISLYIIALLILLSLLLPRVKRSITTNINLMITMLIGGLWHGASWQFVIWGGLNGIGLVVYKFWRKISPWEGKTGWLAHFWMVFLTFNFITLTRIFFRSESNEAMNGMIYRLGNFFTFNSNTGFISEISIIPSILSTYKYPLIIMFIGYIIHWLPSSLKTSYRRWFIQTSAPLKMIIIIVVVFGLYQSISADRPPFIYFKF